VKIKTLNAPQPLHLGQVGPTKQCSLGSRVIMCYLPRTRMLSAQLLNENPQETESVSNPHSVTNGGPRLVKVHRCPYKSTSRQGRWCTPVIPALERLRQEDHNTEASPCLKTNKQ
jgi:hypothetical protein